MVPPQGIPASPVATKLEVEAVPVQRITTSRLMGSVSIKASVSPSAVPPKTVAPQQHEEPLTQEKLKKCWDRLLDNEAYTQLLKGKRVELTGPNTFNIIANNNVFELELKDYKVQILEQLRTWTGVKELTCKVEVRSEQYAAKLYQPKDKYDAMVQDNPTLGKFRELFQDIDY